MKYLNHFLFFLLTIYSCNFYLDTRKITEINYGKEVDIIAKEFDLPTHYLKALIILECSGRKKIKPRFEKHVYKKLDLVKKMCSIYNLTANFYHIKSYEDYSRLGQFDFIWAQGSLHHNPKFLTKRIIEISFVILHPF